MKAFYFSKMIRLLLVCWLITFCWIQNVDSTNEFLKHLLTTTPSSSHISDFRKQKRTDSRADKPDIFPGFDLGDDSTTPSPRKRRRQAYSKLIRLFLQNTKDRLETIRDVIKDESELHFQMTQSTPPAIELDTDDSMERNAKIRFTDDENRQFIDIAFADATDDSVEIGRNRNESKNNAAQTYLNSLFAAVGYGRITTTPNPIDETTQGNIIARYLINPVLSVWNSTRERFNLNRASNDDNADNDDNTDEIDGSATIFRLNFFDNRPRMHTNLTASNMNKDSNENRVNNFNYSLPLTQLTANNVTTVMLTNGTVTKAMTETMTTIEGNANKINSSQSILDVDYIGNEHIDSDNKPRTTDIRSSSIENAAEAFRNAFVKYSNYMQHPMEYAKFDIPTKNDTKFIQSNSNEMKSDKLLDGNGFFDTSNLFDANNSSHIQVVPAKKLKTNDSIGIFTIANKNFNDDEDGNDSIEPKTIKSFAENAGILILEIFGTVIGQTWRAISKIPNYFEAHQPNDIV